MTFEDIRRIAGDYANLDESKAYGSPALKFKGRTIACMAINKSAEPNTLAVRVTDELREDLIAEDSEVYYVTEHYVQYGWVLVRLEHVREDQLRGLIEAAWRLAGA